jgi:hypothetical protein
MIETSEIILTIVIGFGLVLLIGMISWAISIVIRLFISIIMGE